MWDVHVRGAKHMKKSAPPISEHKHPGITQDASGRLFCRLCGTGAMTPSSFRTHCQGRRHLQAMLQASALKTVQHSRISAQRRAGACTGIRHPIDQISSQAYLHQAEDIGNEQLLGRRQAVNVPFDAESRIIQRDCQGGCMDC